MRRIMCCFVLTSVVCIAMAGSPARAQECDEPEDCVTLENHEPITIGVLLLIGQDTYGYDALRGIEIAVARRDGTVAGHPIDLVVMNDGCYGGAAGGEAAASALLEEHPDVVGVLGTTCSGAAEGAASVLGGAGIALISPSNTAPSLTDPASHPPTYLRTAPSDTNQGRALADFAYNILGITTAATLSQTGDTYTDGLANAFATAFEDLGGKVVVYATVSADPDGNVSEEERASALAEIAAAPDTVEFVFALMATSRALRQVVAGVRDYTDLADVELGLGDTAAGVDFLEAVGDDAIGAFVVTPDTSFTSGRYAEFVATYEETYGESPFTPFHAHAFDAANILLDGIKRAVGHGEATLTIDREALLTELFVTTGKGLIGDIDCYPYGECNASPRSEVSIFVEGPDGIVLEHVWP